MKYDASKEIGRNVAPDGEEYTLEFYGEDEGAAVVTGPVPKNQTRLTESPEVHREPATSAADAEMKLRAWVRERGWKHR